MEKVILVLGFVGLLALVFGVFNKLKARRVAGAPLAKTSAARGGVGAAPNGAVSVQGEVRCAQPLSAPVSGTACLYYRLVVEESWKENDAEKTKTLRDEKHAAPFAIDDGSGPVAVDAAKGGDFEPMTTKKETKSPGLIAGISGKDLQFGAMSLSPGVASMGHKFTVTEEYLPLQPRLYVLGKLANGGIAAPGFRNMLITSKSRDELVHAAAKSAKLSFIGGAAAVAIAVILQLVVGGAPAVASADTAECQRLSNELNAEMMASMPAGTPQPNAEASVAAMAQVCLGMDKASRSCLSPKFAASNAERCQSALAGIGAKGAKR